MAAQTSETTTQTPETAAVAEFSPDEWFALRMLQNQYQLDHDLFSRRERAHLLFLRWLVTTGRLLP